MIVGVDVSSHRIDLAWLEAGRPCRWHQELAKGHLIDRLRSIVIQWPTGTDGSDGTLRSLYGPPGLDITDIAIEYPWARGDGIPALWTTVGVVTKQAPPWTRVAWPDPKDLRAAIGCKANKKEAAHLRIRYEFRDRSDGTARGTFLDGWDAHELDALVAAVGWTRILEAQDAQ